MDNRYSKYTHLHMLATNNNCKFDDLPAIAFNNRMNNRFSSKSSIKNGGIMEKEKRGNGKERKSCKLDVTSSVLLWI